VIQLVDSPTRLYPVGRLDSDSEGLVLLTNDGWLTQRLMHPRFEHQKEYRLLVKSRPDERVLEQLRSGVELPDGRVMADEVELLEAAEGGAWLRIVVHQGRKRMLRRMLDALGHPVRRLVRVRIGPLELGDLPAGQARRLTQAEIARLLESVRGLSMPDATPQPRPTRWRPSVIAIDGPVAAGKSTLGRLLAERLGYAYFDTGDLYRAVTWLALQRGIEPRDGPALARLVHQGHIEVRRAGHGYLVQAAGQLGLDQLRDPAVDRYVSGVSSQPEVRSALLFIQRRLARDGQIVMAGRDIGSVVLPNADLKLFITAPAPERARRRTEQMRRAGQAAVYQHVLAEVERRDDLDSRRPVAPLRVPEGAVVVDTGGLSVDESVERVVELVRAHGQRHGDP
jgi:cytidylate kinase